MELRVTPTFFYGATTAAALGLSLGLLLHGPWRSHEGGPRIQLASAAAAELAGEPDAREWAAEPPAESPSTENDPLLYAGYVTPDPLPLVRLAPRRFRSPEPEDDALTQTASTAAAERREIEALISGAEPSPPRLEEQTP